MEEWNVIQDSEVHGAEKKLPDMKTFSLYIDKKQNKKTKN